MKRVIKSIGLLLFFVLFITGCKVEIKYHDEDNSGDNEEEKTEEKQEDNKPEVEIIDGEIYCFVKNLNSVLKELDETKTYRIHIKDENPTFGAMKRALNNHEKIGVHLLLELCTKLDVVPRSAFEECKSLLSIELPSQITKLNDYCFAWCSNLEECVLPAGLKTIGKCAFYFTNLKKLDIPDTVEELNERCFAIQPSLTSITIPDKVKKLPEECFYRNEKLVNIVLPKELEIIEAAAFCCCYELETIIIPDSVKEIHNIAFYECKKLSKLHLPANLEVMYANVYEGCKSLSVLEFPKNVKYIGKLNISHTPVEEFTIPEGISGLDTFCFSGCENLKKVNFVGEMANISELPEGCFVQCKSLKSYTIPEKVTKIDSSCFASSDLKEVSFSECLNEIGFMAFYNCDLSNVSIPVSVTKIGECAFYENKNLKRVTFEGTIEQFRVIIKNSSDDGIIHFLDTVTKAVDCTDGTINIVPLEN